MSTKLQKNWITFQNSMRKMGNNKYIILEILLKEKIYFEAE